MTHRLDRLFRPKSVAVVGATPKGGYGLRTLRNLRGVGFAGHLYAVHPTHREVDGVPAYPTLADLPEIPDAVAAAIPAPAIPALVGQAVELGAGGMVVYAAGFAERDAAGLQRQRQLVAAAGDRLPVIGPNCLGMASFRGRAALWGIELPYRHADTDGVVALAAQSGNMSLTAMLSGRLPAVAYGVSVGNQAVVNLTDCLDYFLSDPKVRVVGLVMEGLADLGRFRALASRAAAADVAVVVLKVGRSARGEAATVAHTGTLAGRDAAYDALFRQTGVHRVDDLDELVALCALLAGHRRPKGRTLSVFASSGGECGLMADQAQAAGVPLAELDAKTHRALRAVLPDYAPVHNPLDLTASAWGNQDIYRAAATAMGTCAGVDVVAFVGDAPTHADPLEQTGWPQMIGGAGSAARQLDVPVVLVTTTTDVVPGLATLAQQNNVVLLAGTRPALRAIALAGTPRVPVIPNPSMVSQPTIASGASGASGSAGTHPAAPPVTDAAIPDSSTAGDSAPDSSTATAILARLGPHCTESDAKRLLAHYGIPVPGGDSATDVDAAVAIAERIGYPVVCKTQAPGLAHKSDIGGVRIGLADEDALRLAYQDITARVGAPEVRVEQMASPGVELIVGGRNDAAGSLVVIGAGGILTELLGDAIGLLWPFGTDDVRQALDRLRIAPLLRGYRGAPPVDVSAIADATVRLGHLLADLPQIAEIDVNPLLCRPNGEGCLALDALIVTKERG